VLARAGRHQGLGEEGVEEAAAGIIAVGTAEADREGEGTSGEGGRNQKPEGDPGSCTCRLSVLASHELALVAGCRNRRVEPAEQCTRRHGRIIRSDAHDRCRIRRRERARNSALGRNQEGLHPFCRERCRFGEDHAML
jgi:hypothetical protein